MSMDPRRAAFRALLIAHGAGSAISAENEEAFISENLDIIENLKALCMLPNSVAILRGHPTNLKMGDAALVVSKFQPGLNALDVLQSCMRPKPDNVTYQLCSNQSEKHTGDIFPTSIKPWDVEDLIRKYFDENRDRLRAISLPHDPRPDENEDRQLTKSETASLIPAFDTSVHASHVTRVIDYVLQKEGQPHLFAHWAMAGNIIPDFMLGIPDNAKACGYFASFLVGEAKGPPVLEDEGITAESNIPELFVKYKAASSSQEALAPSRLFDSVIPQIFGYMSHGGYVYAFLTTLKLTWVLMRLRTQPETLYISKAFERRGEDPSVAQALYWLVHQAVECEDQPYDEATVLKNVTKARQNQDGGSEPDAKRRQVDGSSTSAAERDARHQRRDGDRHAAGNVAGSSSTARELPQAEAIELTEALGEGVSGIVYRGKFCGRSVAIKMADVVKSHDTVGLLDNEVSAYQDLAPLQGHCLPQLVADGHTCGGLARFVATSLISGQRLDEAAASDAQLASALEGLRSIHDSGRLHGDLRAPNVLLEEDGVTVVFIDLGNSRRSSSGDEKKHEERQLRALFQKQARLRSQKR